MKRKIIFAIGMAALLPLAVVSCSREELPSAPSEGDVCPLAITVTDGGYTATDGQTKATENGYRTEFTAGDECGLYIVRGGTVVYNNVKLTATAGADGSLTWQPEARVTLAGGFSDERYFLYYPYQSDMSGKTTVSATDAEVFFAPLISGWQPAADQSTYAAYTASDLMTATGTAVRTNGSISLTFSMTHRMAMAVIEMPPTVYKFTNTDVTIPDYTVASSADFTDGSVQPYEISPDTYRCIVNPAISTAASITGSYDEGNKEFTVSPNDIATGSCKTYKIDGGRPIEKVHDLQPGDYFCKDGSGNWYVISGAEPRGSECIGIVFYAGHHPNDASDYSDTGIGQKNCRGYAVALTDVHDGSFDRLNWEYGPGNVYNKAIDASTSTSDWQGYSNSLKFHEFVNKNENREAGWEMKHFPAALACETYGNRTLDGNGNPTTAYGWQKSLAAPSNTSGWFLPSFGQLQYLYQNRSVLSARMTDVKNSTPTDCGYKEYIKWFSTSWYYWSSTESSRNSAWGVDFSNGSTGYINKFGALGVRSVLAF